MKILVVSQYFYPEDFRVNDICYELSRRGHDVTVITGIPNYPKGEVFQGYEKSYEKPEIINGVKVIRCNNRPRKKGTLNLLLNYYSYVFAARKVLKKLNDEFDVIYGYQMSPVMQIIPALAYKKEHKIPLFLYCCDVWPESIMDTDGRRMSTHNVIYRYFLNVSKRIYKSADLIGVKCKHFIDYLYDVCDVDKNNCKLIYEHAESSYLSIKDKPLDNGVIDFMFLGNFGFASNCCQIIKAADKLNGCFKVHFVGDGSDLENMKRLVKELKLEKKVIFHGRHPQNEINDFYNVADVCLLTLSCKSVIGFTPPAKLTGYMAACRPIVASINGAGMEIINEAKCGLTCPADSVDELAQIMQSVIDNPHILDGMGNRGRQYFLDNFTIEKHVNVLEDELQRLLER